MIEPRDQNGHTAEELRRDVDRHRHEIKRCELRDNFAAIAWHEHQADLCEFAAWALEAPR